MTLSWWPCHKIVSVTFTHIHTNLPRLSGLTAFDRLCIPNRHYIILCKISLCGMMHKGSQDGRKLIELSPDTTHSGYCMIPPSLLDATLDYGLDDGIANSPSKFETCCVYAIISVCSGREVVTAHESESPVSNPEWGPICYKASICTRHTRTFIPTG